MAQQIQFTILCELHMSLLACLNERLAVKRQEILKVKDKSIIQTVTVLKYVRFIRNTAVLLNNSLYDRGNLQEKEERKSEGLVFWHFYIPIQNRSAITLKLQYHSHKCKSQLILPSIFPASPLEMQLPQAPYYH